MKFVAAVFLVATAIVGANTYANTKPESFEEFVMQRCKASPVDALKTHAACVQKAVDHWFE